MPRQAITNLSKGEFGPELYGRVDVPQYGAGVKQGRNFLIQRYGGMVFRPGFRFAGEVDDIEKTYRLVPFQYSIDQAYVHLLGDEQMRPLAEGGFVVEDDLKLVSATYGATTIVEAPFHEYAVGDRIWIDTVATNVPQLNNRYATVLSVPDADHVELDIDSTGFPALTTSTGIIRSGTPPPPASPPPEAPPPAPPPVPDPPPTATPTEDLGGGERGSGPGDYFVRGDTR